MDDGVNIETEDEFSPHQGYDGAERTKDPEFLQNLFLNGKKCNEDTQMMSNVKYSGAAVLQMYGWWIILASILLVYAWKKFVGTKVNNLLTAHRPADDYSNMKKTGGFVKQFRFNVDLMTFFLSPSDIDHFVTRQERMTAARLRMQQELDEKAEKFKEEMRLVRWLE